MRRISGRRRNRRHNDFLQRNKRHVARRTNIVVPEIQIECKRACEIRDEVSDRDCGVPDVDADGRGKARSIVEKVKERIVAYNRLMYLELVAGARDEAYVLPEVRIIRCRTAPNRVDMTDRPCSARIELPWQRGRKEGI